MKIKTTSWHCKFIRKMGDKPKDLCSYIWTLFANIFLCFVAVLTVFIFGFGIVQLTISTSGIFLLVSLAIIGIIFGIWFGYTKIKNSDGLVLSWLRAKKAKMCPLIEYVDPK
jgi:hypothetical protein